MDNWSSRIELLKVCSGSSKLQKKAIARKPPIGGKWSADEDERLREIVNTHGAENWRKVAMSRNPVKKVIFM